MESGFFDLQVNGYAGIDFNADGLTGDGMHTACAKLADDGVSSCLATITTDHVDRMATRLQTIVALRQRDSLVRDMIAGVHIEGPFISREPGYVGAHPTDAAIAADPDSMRQLLDAADGLTRIVTLAPEGDSHFAVTRMLAGQGIVVAAGHCNPSEVELRAAIDAGLSMFTHLGNACPVQLDRHDNIVQRVLSMSDRLHISFIADGAHVPFVALGNYLRLVPSEHILIISDAISAAGCGPGAYQVGRRTVNIGADLIARAAEGSHLVGSTCTLQGMAERLRREVGASEAQLRQWLSENPRQLVSGRSN